MYDDSIVHIYANAGTVKNSLLLLYSKIISPYHQLGEAALHWGP